MSIFQLIVGVILLVVGFWANNTYVAPSILRMIINIILIIILVFLALTVLGIAHLGDVRI